MPISKYLIVICFVLFATPHTFGECTEIKVGGGSWINDNVAGKDSSHGQGVKLLETIANKMGISVNKLPPAPFVRQLFQLKTGEIDMLLGLYPTPQREQDYLLSKPYYYEPLYLVTHKDFDQKIEKLKDLQHLTAVVVRAASYGKDVDAFLLQADSVLVVTEFDQRIGMVLSKRADYFFSSNQVLKMPQYQHPMLKQSEEPLSLSGTVLAISRNSECKNLLDEVNKIIAEEILIQL